MPKTLRASKVYTDFITDRNRALEQIHIRAQRDLSRITYAVLSQIENMAANAALKVVHPSLARSIQSQFEQGVRHIMTAAFPLFVRRLTRLRRSSFVLAYAGEQEAIGRATQRRKDIGRSQFKARLQVEMGQPTLLGDLDKRTWYCLMQLRRQITQAFDLAASHSDKPEEIAQAVRDAFPKIEGYKRPSAVLRKITTREADGDPEDEDKQSWFDFDFIDDADWRDMVADYTEDNLPENRFDNVTEYVGEDGVAKYSWELEQEATEDFVRSVRSGQVAGAEDLGVKEFVWIAIIDSKTCEDCCLPRNGKTTAEIEAFEDDDCDSDSPVPPAHFNCRCDIGPVASVNEVEGPDWESFNEWLES